MYASPSSNSEIIVCWKDLYAVPLFSSFNVELFDGWYKNSILQRMDKLAHSVYINWSGKEFKNGVLLPLPVGRSAKSRYPEWGETYCSKEWSETFCKGIVISISRVNVG